jgi:hypothetical protein
MPNHRWLPQPGAPDLAHCHILYGWREIGLYFRRSKETVRRWHKARAMPIAYIGVTIVIPTAALDVWVLDARRTYRHRAESVVRGPEAA